MEKKSLELFTKKSCKKQIIKNLILEKNKGKGNKIHGKWKGYDNSFNSWINTKDIVT